MSNEKLQQAATIILQSAKMGLDAELADAVEAALSEFRSDKDRAWRLQNPLGTINRTAITLSNWTDLDISECQAAVAGALGDDQATVVIEEILRFGEQLDEHQKSNYHDDSLIETTEKSPNGKSCLSGNAAKKRRRFAV